MNKFIRYFNQNRKGIIITVAIIAFVIILLNIINGLLETDNNETSTNDITGKPIQSSITGEKVSEKTTDENTKSIEDFVKYCNDKQYEEAFQMLTDDCKQEYNNDVSNFKQNYIEKIFNTKKVYELNLWLLKEKTYTYQVTFYDDNLLSTGGLNINQNFQDYITITNENSETKISVNNFINKENINKSETIDQLEIIINNKKVYEEYELYNITIKNNTDKAVMLADRTNIDDICIIDDKEVEYSSVLNEILQNELIVKGSNEKSIEVKFYKVYNTYSRKTKIFKFKNIIMDYEKYIQDKNSSDIDKREVEINIK